MNKTNTFETCCFTGHRSLPAGRTGEIHELLEKCICELYRTGCKRFVSGGAVGFDLLAAEMVLELRKEKPDIKLIMVLPCRNQHAKWTSGDRALYENVLKSADEVTFLCEKYVTGCMQLRNKRMVECSDICVAYFEKRKGGTEYTVAYAGERNCPVINIAEML